MKENVRNVSEKQENMKLNSVNSRKITCDWLKVLNIYTIKTFFLCIYKNDYICSIHCRTMEKDDVEVIESGGEIQINKKHLEKKLDIANIADIVQYYS